MNSIVTEVASADPASVLSTATTRASELLGLSHLQLSSVLGASEASISMVVTGDRTISPTSKEGELATLLIRVYRSLDAMVGSEQQQRHAWIRSYNHALNGVPADMLCTAQGLVTVASYLDGMRAPL